MRKVTLRPSIRSSARAIVTLVPVFYACSVTSGLHIPSKNSPGEDASADAALDGGEARSCEPATWPQRPLEGPDGEGVEFVFAVRDLDFTASGKLSSRVGYDLDGVCTCHDGGPGSCRAASADQHCDVGNGVDNALATLSTGVARPKALDFEPVIREQLATGRSGLLIKVSGYNGGPDDRTVQLSFYSSDGLERIDAGDPAAGLPPPTFTKADRWTINPNDLVGDPSERISGRTATEAYVVGGVLVAAFETPFLLGGMEVSLHTAALVADLRSDPPRLENGVIVGRWEVGAAVTAFGTLYSDGQPICRQVIYQGLIAGGCSAADVRFNRTEDGKDLPCNAFSVGLGFVASEATMGALQRVWSLADCSDAGTAKCE